MGPCAISDINRWPNSHSGCDGFNRRATDGQACLTEIKKAAPIRQTCGSNPKPRRNCGSVGSPIGSTRRSPPWGRAVYVRSKADETERWLPQVCGME